jgi:carboxyl-terminal processing protease
MSTPIAPAPSQPPTASGPPSPPQPGGPSLGVTAIVLVAIGAAAIFWAGLSLGSNTSGRNRDEQAAIEAFTETYQDIADRFIGTPVPQEVLGGAIDGMFQVLEDPNSRYMPPEQYEASLDDARGQFEGIGAVMATIDDDGDRCEPIDESCRLQVLQVLVGTPAEAAGLLAGDVVSGVDGNSLAGITIDDSVLLIRGPRGTDVTLTVEREGEPLEVVITRDTVTSDDIQTATLADGTIGYISIDNFSSNAADDFATDLEAHLEAGLDKLVIDVRDDPGGFVDATVEISSQFLGDGAVFWEEDAQGRQNAIDVIEGGLGTDPALEVVVLVNGGSASASEILGGALQDAGRAQLVGEQTFGKGTVQEWIELPGDTGGYRLSVAKWLTRDKTWIDGTGLTPDVVVEPAGRRFWAGAAQADPGLDLQVQTAVALLLGEPLPSPRPEPTASPGPSTSPAAGPPEASPAPK